MINNQYNLWPTKLSADGRYRPVAKLHRQLSPLIFDKRKKKLIFKILYLSPYKNNI